MFAKFVTATLLCMGALSLAQAATKLTDFVTLCSLKDPKLDDCLTIQARALLPHIVSGVRDWGIMPMDPLLLPNVVLQNGNGESVGLSLNVSNTKHWGWKTLIIKKVTLDPKTFDMHIDLHAPFYIFVGDYEVKGRILLLPIVGSGPINITFVNTNLEVTGKFKVEERGGKRYLTALNGTSVVTPGSLKYKAENLFNNKQLSDQMNVFLNENSIDVFSELKESLEAILADVTLAVISRIFNKVQLNQLFTDVDS